MQNTIETLKNQMLQFKLMTITSNETKYELIKSKMYISHLEEENSELHEAIDEALNKIKENEMANSYKVGKSVKKGLGSEGEKTKNNIQHLKLLSGDHDDEFVSSEETIRHLSIKRLFKRLSMLIEHYFPFKNDIKRIHASFGATVSAYFLFNRWIIMQFFVVSCMVFVFTVYHVFFMISSGNISLIIGFSKGLLPNFMMYSSFKPDEKLNYSIMITLGMILILINVVRKYVKEDAVVKQVDLSEGESYTSSYAKDVLVAWDNNLSSQQEVVEFSGSLFQLFTSKLFETHLAGETKKLTDYQLFIIYLRRFIGFIFFIVYQILSYALIIYLTINTSDIQEMFSNLGALQKVMGSIPSLGVSIINSISPALILSLTKFEKWERSIELNILLSRLFLANILNVFILAFSYFLLSNPYLLSANGNDRFSIRSQVEIPFNSVYPCRMDQVQNGLFQLIITDWVSKNISVLIGGIVPVIKSRIFGNPVIKPEFDLAPSILSHIFSAGLFLITFPFSPLSMILSPILLSISIKWERYFYMNFYTKPKNPWKAQKAGIIFTRLYLLTVLSIGITSTIFFLNVQTFPKSCNIQDSAVGACSSSIVNDVCTLDVTSNYVNSNGTICSPYPACICAGSLACGPFINDLYALEPLKIIIVKIYPLAILWEIFLRTSYGPWFLIFFVFILVMLRKNTIKVSSKYFEDREKSQTILIKSLETDKKRLQKSVERYKLIQSEPS
jgi:hypothetical protein